MTNSIRSKMNFNNTLLPVAGFLALVLVVGMVSPVFANGASCSFNAGFSNGGTGTCTYQPNATAQELSMFIIVENVTSADARLYFEFSGLSNEVYQIKKTINNLSGETFTTFSHELLDPSGQANDNSDQANAEPWTTPSFPTGFSHSNNGDGLSFAMGFGVPRTSTTWSTVLADEVTTRDFLEFKTGALLNGTSDFTTMGLHDGGANQPFLLAESPRPINDDVLIGGTVGSLGTTSLLIAGAQANMGWWSIAMIGAVAIGAGIVFKVKSNKTEE